MTAREGSLEAPTRHPIDWKNPEYWEKPKIVGEMERIFDICHGCRRCVSLCNTFPKLFDSIDKTDTGELHAVPKEKFWEVVDQCYLCDLCYMVKCPYVPPHPWNVDFPHLMLRAKAYQFREGKMKHPVRDRMLSSTDRNGRLATIPVVVQAVVGNDVYRPRASSVPGDVQEAAGLRLLLDKVCSHCRAGRKRAHRVVALSRSHCLNCTPTWSRSSRICSMRRSAPSACRTPSTLARPRERPAAWRTPHSRHSRRR